MRREVHVLLAVIVLAGGAWGAAIGPARAEINLGTLFRAAAGSPSADAIIRNLVQHGRSAEFVGTQETDVHQPERRFSKQRVTQNGGRRRIEYLAPADLKGKEIYIEGSRSASPVGGVLSPEIGLRGDMQRLEKRALGAGSVAGRSALIVEISTGAGGGSRKVWVDAEKWVPLKWEDRDGRGALVSTTAYTDIRYGGDIPELLPPSGISFVKQPKPTTIDDAEERAGFDLLKPGYLPRGYQQKGVTVTPFGGHGREIARRVTLVYSSGLGVITFVQAPAQAIRDAPKPGQMDVGPLGRIVWVRDNVHCVLIATPPLSVDEMKKIAASVK